MDLMRKEIEALFGKSTVTTDAGTKKFTDDDVCHYYLAGCCPFELLEGTKSDLGPCPRYHALPLKNDYEEARKKEDFGYDYELMLKLDEIVRDCDARIKKHEQRIQLEEQEKIKNDPIEREIYELQQKAEKLGEEGNVDAYMEITRQIEALKQKKFIEQTQQVPTGLVGEVLQRIGPQSQQQKLRPCEVCGSLLSVNDKRLADHYAGKLHSGWVTIRNKLKELKSLHEQGKLLVKTPTSKSRSREREKGNSTSRSRDFETERSRDRDKDRERRDRDGDKDRDRKDRDRDRDRNRERDWDRNREDRSRDRRRDREKTNYEREMEERYRDVERDRERETKYREKRESRI